MSQRISVISAGTIGNALEWYDFSVFGIFATALAQHFFPRGNFEAALLASFGIFAVGYFLRPVGGLIIGHIGDRVSRRVGLVIAILLMGFSTTFIGVLPTYTSVGLFATFFLIVLRVIQGLAVGGEFPGSVVVLAEQAPENRQAFFASLALVGAMVGLLIGSGVANVLTVFLSQSQIQAWGWRIPFLLGIVLAVIGFYLRTRVWQEDKKALLEQVKVPLIQLLINHKKALAKSICLLSLGAVLTGILSIFLVTYLTHYVGTTPAYAYQMLLIVTLVTLIVFPLAAYLADRFQCHRQWLITGLIILVITANPLFVLMQHGHTACTVAVCLLAMVGYGAYAPFIPLLINLYTKRVRFSGVAVTHGLVFSLIAGPTPLLANWLVLKEGVVAPSYCIIVAGLLVLLAVWSCKQ